MTLQRIYSNWDAVKDATGTPASRKRKVWREVLKTRPAIAYWGDSWFSTPLYKNLYWNSFSRIDGISLRLGGPGLTAAKMLTPANCREQAERLKSREFDLVCLSIGGNDALGFGAIGQLFALEKEHPVAVFPAKPPYRKRPHGTTVRTAKLKAIHGKKAIGVIGKRKDFQFPP